MEITKTHLKAIQEVAAALRMTVNEFLTEEVRGIAPEQAREYLKAFASDLDPPPEKYAIEKLVFLT